MNKIIDSQLIRFLWSFMEEHQLVEQKKYLLALSGGSDSVFLLRAFYQMKELGLIESLRAIHINHKLRHASDSEEKWVLKLCETFDIPLAIKRVDLSKERSNIEAQAREFRYQSFYQERDKDELIVTAHHLDDSFEWSLMQQFRSASVRPGLGIPCRYKKVVRPLLCLSKEQMLFQLEKLEQGYCEDESNQHLHFDRNYVRQKLIPTIKKRYPQYLKHYVYRSNQLARELGLHQVRTKMLRSWRSKNAVLLFSERPEDFKKARTVVSEALTPLSLAKRGVIEKQLDKLLQMPSGQGQGPLSFSGGVKALAQRNVLFLYSSRWQAKYQHPSQESFLDFSRYRQLLLSSLNDAQLKYFPFWVKVISDVPFSLPGSSHPLKPDFYSKGMIPAFDLLRLWQKDKKIKKRALKLVFYF